MGKLVSIVRPHGEDLTAEDTTALDAAQIELDGWLGSEDIENSRSFSCTANYMFLIWEATDGHLARESTETEQIQQMCESLRNCNPVDVARGCQGDYDEVKQAIQNFCRLFEVCVERNLELLAE